MIYTCYFSGLGDRCGQAVSICYQQPARFNLPVAEELCPPLGMYYKFRSRKMSQRKFEQLYTIRFGVLDPAEIAAKYDGKILTSWEGYEDRKHKVLSFSHRHLIAEWLRKNGIEVMELPPAPKRVKVGF